MDPYSEPARRPPTADSVSHAEFHLREDGTGVGAAVVRSSLQHGERMWDVIVRDADEWHYVRVLGSDLGPFPSISTEDIERGIERFAATLPAERRLRQLLNANPLHIGRDGKVRDYELFRPA
jgi:hypothetical protein